MIKHNTAIIALATAIISGCATPINPVDPKSLPLILTTNGPRPTVLIAHGCEGSASASYRLWARDLNTRGYNVVLVDSFKPRGIELVCNRGLIAPPWDRAGDLDSVAQWARHQPWHQGGVSVIGFSHGGSTVLNVANNSGITSIDSAIAYYPECATSFVGRATDRPRIPTQVHVGMLDEWTPAERCGQMPKYQFYRYADAHHGFDVVRQQNRKIFGYTIGYQQQAAELSRQRVYEFLESTIGVKQ